MAAPPKVTVKALRRAGVGAFFRPMDVAAIGISETALRQLVREGEVEKVARGVYRVTDVDPGEHFSLAAVCARVPKGILCLRTALQFHRIGTRVSPDVWLAIPHGMRTPTLDLAAVRIVRFKGRFLVVGVESVVVEGVQARITDPIRTVIDCFRMSRWIDRETAIEAMRAVLQERRASPAQILRMATSLGAAGSVRKTLEVLGA
jgi:predicted transcriptional regulator of viral defense system